MKTNKWAVAKTILITYLAVSKILYWIDAASDMMQGDFGGAWISVMLRIIGRDGPLLLAVIGFVAIHKMRGRLWIKLIAGYAATIGILFSYLFIMVSLGRISVMSYFNLFVYYSFSYAIINVVLLFKEWLKRKSKMEDLLLSNEQDEPEHIKDT
ncbi:MAG: hypothetical protein FWC71_06810 [Defluviitaleaceae bacterium]|nr:hypothetical protein [Defluviitaleaceae bacterium]